MAIINGAFFTNDCTRFSGTTLVNFRTLGTQHTLLAPALHVKIALFAVGAMASVAYGTVSTKLGSVGHRALLIIVHTVAAQATFTTKMRNLVIAFITAGAVGLPPIYDTIKAKALSVVAATRSVYIDTILA